MTALPRPGAFARLAAWVLDHPRMTVGLTLLVSVLSVLLATRLSVNPNVLDLLPAEDPTTAAIRQLNDEEGGAGLLTIAVTGGADDETRRAWTRALAAELERDPDIEWVLYELDEDMASRLGMLQLDTAELSTIRTKLQGALAMGPAAQNPLLAARLLDLGPLTKKLADPAAAQVLSGKDGTERILARPRGSAFDPKFSRPFMARVHAAIDAADPAASGLRIAWIGGPYRHAVEDLETVLHDLTATLAFSLTLVLLFMAAAFRSPRAVVLVVIPLLAGTLWTVGVAGLVVGKLNTFTSYFTAVLIGLGIDFGIHLYARYREERAHSATTRLAVQRAWDAAGPPCLTAAITSAAGFSALWIADFEGFQQLGTLLASGILLCLLAQLVLLPLLLERFDRSPSLAQTPIEPKQARLTAYRRAPALLALGTLLVLACVPTLRGIPFEFDISEMRSKGRAYADLSEEERALARESYVPLVVSLPDEATVRAEHARLEALIEAGELPTLRGVLSVRTVLPQDQAERVALLQEISVLARQEGVRYLPPPVQQNLRSIAASEPRVLSPADLPPGVRQLIGASGEHHRLMLLADGNMWDIRHMVELRSQIEVALPDVVPASEYLATARLFDLMQFDAPRIAILALVLVFLASWADLRNLPRALVAIAALLAGLVSAGAIMAAADVPLSMVNFVGIPILMGIGVDIVIHLMHRIQEEGPGGVLRALRTTGWAALMSALTTVISFSSLTLADSQGVQSLGKLIVLGLTMIVVTSFVLIPLGWMSVWSRRHPSS